MRLFIGLVLPESVQEALKQAWHQASPESLVSRSIRSSMWHVTLAFLDDVPVEHVEAIRQLVATAVATPPGGAFSIDGFEAFPYRRPSRIVARIKPEQAEAWEECVLRLRDMISIIAPNIDRKPWQPHISITRSEKGKYLEQWAVDIPTISWTPQFIAMIKSTPGPQGAVYEILSEIPCHTRFG